MYRRQCDALMWNVMCVIFQCFRSIYLVTSEFYVVRVCVRLDGSLLWVLTRSHSNSVVWLYTLNLVFSGPLLLLLCVSIVASIVKGCRKIWQKSTYCKETIRWILRECVQTAIIWLAISLNQFLFYSNKINYIQLICWHMHEPHTGHWHLPSMQKSLVIN